MANYELKEFGKHLKKLRKLKGLSQEQFAELTGLHRTYIGGLERGERNPTLLTLIKISRSLKIELTRLAKFKERTNE